MEKLYCYVDETGQHTYGAVFVVSVIVVKKDRDELALLLEEIESVTGKKTTKWMKSRRPIRQGYLQEVFTSPSFRHRIFYSQTTGSRAYSDLTLATIADSVKAVGKAGRYKASIFIDGLKRSEHRSVSTELHRMGIATEKVRGVTDESSPLIRLADAVAGVVREAEEGRAYAQELCSLGKRRKVLVSL